MKVYLLLPLDEKMLPLTLVLCMASCELTVKEVEYIQQTIEAWSLLVLCAAKILFFEE